MWLYASIGKIDDRIYAKKLLKYGINKVWSITEMPDIELSRLGKPWFPKYPDYHFNLSHSGSYFLCGLSNTPIGVDIEAIVTRRADLALCLLNLPELVQYSESDDQDMFLYQRWTLKESYCKCTGEGLNVAPQDTVFDIKQDGTILSNRSGFTFKSYIGEGWVGAVCVQGRIRLPEIEWLS